LRPDPKIKAERQVPANYYQLIAATIRALPPALDAMTAALFMNVPGPFCSSNAQIPSAVTPSVGAPLGSG
jgi:hypothetical protein